LTNLLGLGKGLAEVYLSRPNNTVIVGVRDTSSTTAKALSSLPVGQSSKLIVVKIDSKSYSDPAAAIKVLQTTYGINSLDVVIANAGVTESDDSVEIVPLSVVEEHIAVNSIAPLALFQAVFPLLQKASNPKFTIVSSAMGTISAMEQRPYPAFPYGASKALANYTIRKIHFTHKEIISFALDPG
jgi:norsolorinic acid ketoreductase